MFTSDVKYNTAFVTISVAHACFEVETVLQFVYQSQSTIPKVSRISFLKSLSLSSSYFFAKVSNRKAKSLISFSLRLRQHQQVSKFVVS